MNRLRPLTRVLLALAVAALGTAYFLPLWEIQLWAPQYPEGLNMKIWLDRISGDYQIINGINHYIGMKAIKEEMFPEFRYMGMMLGGLIALGMMPVLTGRRAWLQVFVAVLLLGGALGIYDFWRWGQDYGSDLDPKAAISVPGMTYDPPLIGYKNLLNFTAYSGPERGGWVLIGVGVVVCALLAWEHWRGRRSRRRGTGLALLLPLLLLLGGCETGPQPIDYGKDECAECRMTLVDQHYGTQIVSPKGKISKFDDVNCMIAFANAAAAKGEDAGRLHIVDFTRPNTFLPVADAVFLRHPGLRAPMGSQVAAFANEQELRGVLQQLGGEGAILRWEEVRKLSF